MCLFALANFWGPEIQVHLDRAFGTRLAGQRFKASFVPWFFMFLLGTLAQRRHEWLVPRLLDRALVIFVGYFLVVIADHFGGDHHWETISPFISYHSLVSPS